MKPAHTRPVVPFERRGPGAPRQPFKQKAWNHQDELKDAIGKTVVLCKLNGLSVEGELVGADQFALKVRLAATEGKSALTFYKHGLEAYGVKG